MKKIIVQFAVVCFIITSCVYCIAQTPDWEWAKRMGGNDNDYVSAISVDFSGNIYMTGIFYSDTVLVDTSIITNSGSANIYLIKYNPYGDVLWAKCFGGTNYDVAISVVVDDLGNIFLAGCFNGPSLSIDTTVLTNSGSGTSEIYIVKFDSIGNVIWAKSAAGASSDFIMSMVIDTSGNSYLSGYFNSPFLTFDTITLTKGNYSDIFLVKYDSSGNVQWAKSALGNNEDRTYNVAVDLSGNAYVAGTFKSPTISFGTYTLANYGTWNIFLAKYDINGNEMWARSASGTMSDGANSVATDKFGNVYITGYYTSPFTSFDTIVITNTGTSPNFFLVKYDTSGNTIWAQGTGGPDWEEAYKIVIDDVGDINITGCFSSPTLSLGPNILTNAGLYDLFLSKYNSAGDVQWATSIGGNDDDRANSIALDNSGNTYLAGYFRSSSVIIDTTTLINEAAGSADVFLAKLSGVTVGNTELPQIPCALTIYPNPANDMIKISIIEKSIIEIFNLNGQIIKRLKTNNKNMNIDISDFTNGLYFVKATNKNGVAVGKFIKE